MNPQPHHSGIPSPSGPRNTKPLWVVICALVSLVVAFAADALTRHAGSGWEMALLAGGAAFGGALTLSLLVLDTLYRP